MISRLLAVLAMAALSGHALSQTPPPEAAASAAVAAAPAPASGPDRMVCKFDTPTGSRIPTKVCKTAAAWEWESEQSRKMIQDAQQRTGSTRSR